MDHGEWWTSQAAAEARRAEAGWEEVEAQSEAMILVTVAIRPTGDSCCRSGRQGKELCGEIDHAGLSRLPLGLVLLKDPHALIQEDVFRGERADFPGTAAGLLHREQELTKRIVFWVARENRGPLLLRDVELTAGLLRSIHARSEERRVGKECRL